MSGSMFRRNWAQDVVGWVQGRVGDHAQLDGGVGSSMVEVEPLD